MSIQDRDWYREGGESRWSIAGMPPKWMLIAVTTAAFLAQAAAENGSPDGERFIATHLGLSLQGIRRGEAWQVLTHMLLHGGLGHLAWNMIGLWVFATVLEDRLVPGRVCRLYIVGGLGGAGGHLLWALAGLPGANAVVEGASGAVTALLVYAALGTPSMPVNLLFIPVPLWLVGALFVARDAVEAAIRIAERSEQGEVAVQAHLGGAAAAVAMHFLSRRRRRPQEPRRPRRERIEEDSVLLPVGPSADEAAEEARMDALLDRIHSSGIGSLTEEERDFLNRVSERYRGRKR